MFNGGWSREDEERIRDMSPGHRWAVLAGGLAIGIPLAVLVIWLVSR